MHESVGSMNMKQAVWNIGHWLLALLLMLLLQDVWRSASEVAAVSCSDFEQSLADGRIAEVTVFDRSISGRLKSPDGPKTTLVAVRVETALPML